MVSFASNCPFYSIQKQCHNDASERTNRLKMSVLSVQPVPPLDRYIGTSTIPVLCNRRVESALGESTKLVSVVLLHI
jgi:hypothetical protein